MISKSIVVKLYDKEIDIINNTMNKYDFNRSEAVRYIINAHERHEENSNAYYRKLMGGFVMKITDALNEASKTGNTKYAYEVVEELKCQIL